MSVREASEDTTYAVKNLSEVTEKFVDMMDKKFDQDRLNEEEERRENNRQVPRRGFGAGIDNGFRQGLAAGAGFSLINLINPARLVTLIFGGALAGLGVAGGLRGWETGFVNSFFRRFFGILGLTDDGRLPDEAPRVTLLQRITRALGNLENRILRFFGVDTTGALLRDELGRFTGGRGERITVVSRITAAIDRLLSPLTRVATAIDDWILGPGARIIGFIGGTGAGQLVGGVFRLASKILWPIGILISAFDAVSEWQNSTETNQVLRFIDSIGAFLGDFIGAPLDLLRSVVAAVMDWVGLQSAAEWLRSFSFEERIGNMISIVARIPRDVINYVNGIMADWNLAGTISGMYDSAVAEFNSAWENVANYVMSTKDTIETGFFNALDRAEVGFLRVSTFIQNLPDRLLRLVGRILDFQLPRLAIPYDNWLMGAGEIELFPGGRPFSAFGAAGQAADERIVARNENLDASIERLETQIADRLAALEARRGELQGAGAPVQVTVAAPTQNTNLQSNTTNITAFPSPFNEYAPQ